jgi:hypothetical protein
MVICGSYMFEFSVSKGMKRILKIYKNIGGGSRKGNTTFMSNTNCQVIEI